MEGSTPSLRSLVLVGGGHSHVHVLKMLGMEPLAGVEVTLVTRDVDTPYSGMLPGHVAGHYTREECHLDLGKAARFAKAALVHTEAVGMDCERKLIFCKDGRPPIRYDVVSIDIGSSPSVLRPVIRNLTPVKPIDGFSARWSSILNRVLGHDVGTGEGQAARGRATRVVVVGGGAGGVELALAMTYRLRAELRKRNKPEDSVCAALVTRGATIMESHNGRVQDIMKRILGERGMETYYNCPVADVEEEAVGVANGDEESKTATAAMENQEEPYCGHLVIGDGPHKGERISYDECVWCTQASCQSWLRDTGLELTEDGFICVDDYLRSVNTPGVFACGDCAHMVNHPRPKAGVFAVRQGPPLVINLKNSLLGQPLEEYIPQSQFLGLISTGAPYCVGSRGPLALEGEYLWELKDYIDRTWMKKYQELPEMDMPEPEVPEVAKAAGEDALNILAHATMRCAGCGSKVGSTVLSRVLKQLAERRRATLRARGDDREVPLDQAALDDAAIIPIRAEDAGKLQVQTVDFFRSFIPDPFVFGKIAANHALSDIHAMNAEPRHCLALSIVPYGRESQVEQTLLHMLAGAATVFDEEGCDLVGGHTVEGDSAALGFACTGVVAPDDLLRKGGMAPGQALVLTKPVGTGTLLAADMRVKARGVWVSAATESMVLSNRRGARVLRNFNATCATDVTGFGLLGHLVEMVQASPDPGPGTHLRVRLNLDAIPVFPGALECVHDYGIVSSLQPDNARCRRALVNESAACTHRKYPLLFDPQTAGGLLACVPMESAEECVRALVDAGYPHSAVVGAVGSAVDLAGLGGVPALGSDVTATPDADADPQRIECVFST